MATAQVTRNIALTHHFDRFVQAKVSSGRYQSVSEVVRDALRLLEEREARQQSMGDTQRDIEVGWRQSEAGEVVDGPAVFAEIRKMSKARRAAARVRR
jgi:antitoxin ParD1/3/4